MRETTGKKTHRKVEPKAAAKVRATNSVNARTGGGKTGTAGRKKPSGMRPQEPMK